MALIAMARLARTSADEMTTIITNKSTETPVVYSCGGIMFVELIIIPKAHPKSLLLIC